MDIIEMTRELGKALQQDDRYIAYSLAKQVNDDDTELQADIKKFESLRLELNTEMSRSDLNGEKLKQLDADIKEIYAKIMANENMKTFTAAQNALEGLVTNINQIISLCASGEDPATCQPSPGCSGSCETCGGCG